MDERPLSPGIEGWGTDGSRFSDTAPGAVAEARACEKHTPGC